MPDHTQPPRAPLGPRPDAPAPPPTYTVSVLLLLLACHPAEPPACAGDTLFGQPDAYTGLDAGACAPTCADCGGSPWTQPVYTDADFDAWRAWTLLDPPAPPATDPYATSTGTTSTGATNDAGPETVCAFVPASGTTYRLHTYDTTADARRDGATPTHYGACGLCSSLADLAVYASQPELTILTTPRRSVEQPRRFAQRLPPV